MRGRIGRLAVWATRVRRAAFGRLRSRYAIALAVAAGIAILAAAAGASAAGALLMLLVLEAAVLLLPLSETSEGDALRDRLRQVERSRIDWPGLLDALPDPALVLDRQGVIRAFNARAADLMRAMRSEVSLSAVIRNPELLAAASRAQSAEAPETVVYTERLPLERRIEASLARLPHPAGPEEPSVLVMFRDLTPAARIEQMRSDFIANASHELRTPLTAVIGFIETLQGPAREDAAARERFLAIMASQAQRMKRLVDDLMSLSELEMRAHLKPSGTVDLNEVALHVEEALQPLVKEHGVTLRVRLLDRPALVRGDRDELVQVVQNLVHNAIRHGREHGQVDVAVRDQTPTGVAERDGDPTRSLWVSVADDGPGIASRHIPRLTERFYRVDIGTSRKKGGTGLGLAIVKHILTRHRGELHIRSHIGVGSTFHVQLPEA